MKRLWVIGAIAAVIVIGIAAYFIVGEGPDQREEAAPIAIQETIGDLAYEVHLDQDRFGLDDKIIVRTKITNLGSEKLSYVSGSSSCPRHADVNIAHEQSGTQLTNPSQICTSDEVTSILEPGKAAEGEIEFLPEQWKGNKLVPAETGAYEVTVALPLNREQIELKMKRETVKTTIVLE
ncbi:hypothetical protein FHS18_004240 [Paenibacillus phyllosphaerae]|uniref:Uncharacterized protein n=1 Tax=Paenibacillus phyllosphaerae TaxID=274593 RepID=A0A7W5B0I2_9BACL|nr:hypothetical protein [Paenibacillus phyllosphaerae]MBB3112162.1 hypothetical protein [Paenibacillus phyllosphaerae]